MKQFNNSTIDSKTKVFCIFGHPVKHSLSPTIHNFAFAKNSLNYIYLAFDVTDIKKAALAFREFNFMGASITVPHKIKIMKYLDHIDPLAKKIGACNTLINKNGLLTGYNTDWYGAIFPLKQIFEEKIKEKKAILLGAGGAARAIAFGLNKEKIPFVILNRNVEKADILKKQTDALAADSLGNFEKYRNFDIIINATPLGLEGENEKKTAVDTNHLSNKHVVFDIVYKPKTTQLLKDAQKKGAKIIYGYKMLLYQAQLQFELFTGKNLPINESEKIIVTHLAHK